MLSARQRLFTFILSSLRQLGGTFFILCLLLVGQAMLMVLAPLPLKYAIDRMSDLDFVLQMVALSVGLGVIILLSDVAEDLLTTRHVNLLLSSLRQRLSQAALQATYQYHLTRKKIDLVGRLSQDVSNLEIFVSTLVTVVVRSVPSFFILWAALYWNHMGLAIAVLIFVPLLFWVATWVSARVKAAEKRFRSETQNYEDVLYQGLDAISLLKSLTAEKQFLNQVSQQNAKLSLALKLSRYRLLALTMLFNATRILARPSLLLVGGLAMSQNQISLGQLFVLASYVEFLQKPLFEISNLLSRWPKAVASFERMDELSLQLDQHQEKQPSVGPGGIPENAYELGLLTVSSELDLTLVGSELDIQSVGVVFLQPHDVQRPLVVDDHKIVLSDVTLKIPKASLVAIVGPSGAGKSTLLKALNGLVPVSSGSIRYGTQDLARCSPTQLRQTIRLILQENLLLSGTVYDNVILGLSGPLDHDSVYKALALANADVFVRQLPQGILTRIGEGGHPLSGGQSRRICLSRGFINAPLAKIVGFDEPTSGLDRASAEHVLSSLEKLRELGKTVLWTTHTESEIERADFVIEVSQGTAFVRSQNRTGLLQAYQLPSQNINQDAGRGL